MKCSRCKYELQPGLKVCPQCNEEVRQNAPAGASFNDAVMNHPEIGRGSANVGGDNQGTIIIGPTTVHISPSPAGHLQPAPASTTPATITFRQTIVNILRTSNKMS